MGDSDSNEVSVSTGLAEDKYEFTWKIHNVLMVLKDEDILDFQKFEILTKSDSLRLHSKWIVGLRRHCKEDKKGDCNIFCQLMNVIPDNDAELLCHFTVQLLNPSGVFSQGWTCERKERMKVNDCFTLEEHSISYSHIHSSTPSHLDAAGAVTLHVTLGIIYPLHFERSQLHNLQLFQEQFIIESGTFARENLVQILQSDGAEFDTKVVCSDGQEWQCHKDMLKANSPVLKSFLESGLSEVKAGVLQMSDISGKTMGILLQFFYTGKLSSSWSDPDVIVELTFIAGKYQITPLLHFLDNMLGNSGNNGDLSSKLLALKRLAKKYSLQIAESQLTDQIVHDTLTADSFEAVTAIFSNENNYQNKIDNALVQVDKETTGACSFQ